MHSRTGYNRPGVSVSQEEREALGIPPGGEATPKGEGDNIYGRANAEDRFKAYGPDEAAPDGVWTKELVGKLARRMTYGTDYWSGLDAKGENGDITAGYTYLSQLVAHDLVANLVSISGANDQANFTNRDFREERLVLETIYGGGPTVSPSLYARPDPSAGHDLRIRMRLGRPYRKETMNSDGGFSNFTDGIYWWRMDRHDIPRTSCPFLNEKPPKRGFTDALLADPRNDDNLILSQLCTVFMDLHNWICETLEQETIVNLGGLDNFRAHRIFLKTRKMVALLYRRIIIHDVMKLLLDEGVYERFFGGDGEIAPQASSGDAMPAPNKVPVEFSHAVFRFAHSMVRPSYQINIENLVSDSPRTLDDILKRTSSDAFNLTPIACDWLVDWELFFDLEPHDPRIEPNLSLLINPEFFGGPLTQNSHFANEDDVEKVGLVYLDLISGAEAGVRNLRSLCRLINPADRARSALLPSSDLSATATPSWAGPIAEWLSRPTSSLKPGLTKKDIALIANDPPLVLFTLFEAAFENGGRRLGVLGSTVVAEVVASALGRNWDAVEGDSSIQKATQKFFGGDVPKTMPDLLEKMMRAGRQTRVTCDPKIS